MGLERDDGKKYLTYSPIPVDLKACESRPGLREFYSEKKPSNHYEKVAVFVYYLTRFNKKNEVKFGEILSCYEEVDERKPSVSDIVKNAIRYKGWLGQGSDKLSTRLTVSGENLVKFDLPRETNLDHSSLDKPLKQKLTLGLDGDVIEKARTAGINISAITEQVLKAMTFRPSGSSNDDIVQAYEKLFETATTVLGKYNAQVEVGLTEYHDPFGTVSITPMAFQNRPIILDSDGKLWKFIPSLGLITREQKIRVGVSEVVRKLYPPMKILENIILSLIAESEKNKERMKEFEIALRFIRVLSEGTEGLKQNEI